MRLLLALALGGATACSSTSSGKDAPKSQVSTEESDPLVGYDLRRLRPREEERLGDTFDRVFARASKEGRRVVVYFSADWCAPCRELELEMGGEHPASAIGDVRIFQLKEEDWKDAGRFSEFNDLRRRWYAPLGSYPVLLLLDGEGKLREEMKEAKERLDAEGIHATLPSWFANTATSAAPSAPNEKKAG